MLILQGDISYCNIIAVFQKYCDMMYLIIKHCKAIYIFNVVTVSIGCVSIFSVSTENL